MTGLVAILYILAANSLPPRGVTGTGYPFPDSPTVSQRDRYNIYIYKLRSLNIFSRFYYYTVKAFLISCNVCADAGGTVISLPQHMVTNKTRLNILQFFVYRADPSC
jgi:hypothetical protein